MLYNTDLCKTLKAQIYSWQNKDVSSFCENLSYNSKFIQTCLSTNTTISHSILMITFSTIATATTSTVKSMKNLPRSTQWTPSSRRKVEEIK